MNIIFRQGSEELSDALITRAQKKLSRLSRLISEGTYEALVYVDVERESGAQTSDNMWRTSINLDLAGDHFNAVEMGSTPEKATDLAIKEMKRVVRKAKGKERAVLRRGGGLLKRFQKGFS